LHTVYALLSSSHGALRDLHSFPTRRSSDLGLIRMLDLLVGVPALVMSDLGEVLAQNRMSVLLGGDHTGLAGDRRYLPYRWFTEPDRKSTRLNSSHVKISYAVFCLKKKRNTR